MKDKTLDDLFKNLQLTVIMKIKNENSVYFFRPLNQIKFDVATWKLRVQSF